MPVCVQRQTPQSWKTEINKSWGIRGRVGSFVAIVWESIPATVTPRSAVGGAVVSWDTVKRTGHFARRRVIPSIDSAVRIRKPHSHFRIRIVFSGTRRVRIAGGFRAPHCGQVMPGWWWVFDVFK